MEGLFGDLDIWKRHWKNMPEFIQEKDTPYQSLTLHFRDEIDRDNFSKLINQKITEKTKYLYYPRQIKENLKNKICSGKGNPQYPIYVISKGRWESRQTVKALEKRNIPYRIVIEPTEYKQYKTVIAKKNILILPFHDLGQGSIPARNWVWEHSISEGWERHWILDDNICDFYRLNRNMKYRTDSGLTFKIIEDFVNRYENIGIAGMQYELLAPRIYYHPAIDFNTRVYSCILIQNDLPFRWRGKYNEDTDLCLHVLKKGYCTVLFYAFLADKMGTMRMKGGNTDELYDEKIKGRLLMAESLKDQHPDVAKVIKKWGRHQHHVDYSKFKRRNKPILKKGIQIPEVINEYGMKFINLES